MWRRVRARHRGPSEIDDHVAAATSEIDPKRCLARVWNQGTGGQCARKPKDADQVFCTQHSLKGMHHGRVDDGLCIRDIPRFQAVPSPPVICLPLDEARRLQLCPAVSSLRVADYSMSRATVATESAAVFCREGFVIVQEVFNSQQLESLLAICENAEKEIHARDGNGFGNRGHGRYSLGMADESGHLLHREGFAKCVVDCSSVLDVVDQIFSEQSYVCAGGGGDFVVSGVAAFQRLHSDIQQAPSDFQKCPLPPLLVVNYCLQDLSHLNGPTRVIPGSQKWFGTRPPSVQEEQKDWLHSKIFPLRAGDAIIRDARMWHGGTPNLDISTRFLPAAEFHSYDYHTWLQDDSRKQSRWGKKCMPNAIFTELSPRAQKLCGHLVVGSSKTFKAGVKRELVYHNGSDGAGGNGFLL